MFIHPTAIVEKGAVLGEGSYIGPYSVIGPKVRLGANCRLESHVAIAGNTEIGPGNHFFPFCSIGHAPQDLKYKGEESRLVIGGGNKFREQVTANPGTEGGGMITGVGDNCLFMVGAHIAHDCKVGNNVVLANNATLAGHVEVGDFAIIGGLSAIHQFVRIGKHAIIGGMSGIENDVIPYASAMGERAHLSGLNIVGLKRRGFGREDIHTLRSAYRLLFSPEGTLAERIEDAAELFKASPLVMEVVGFMKSDSSRNICQPKSEPE